MAHWIWILNNMVQRTFSTTTIRPTKLSLHYLLQKYFLLCIILILCFGIPCIVASQSNPNPANSIPDFLFDLQPDAIDFIQLDADPLLEIQVSYPNADNHGYSMLLLDDADYHYSEIFPEFFYRFLETPWHENLWKRFSIDSIGDVNEDSHPEFIIHAFPNNPEKHSKSWLCQFIDHRLIVYLTGNHISTQDPTNPIAISSTPLIKVKNNPLAHIPLTSDACPTFYTYYRWDRWRWIPDPIAASTYYKELQNHAISLLEDAANPGFNNMDIPEYEKPLIALFTLLEICKQTHNYPLAMEWLEFDILQQLFNPEHSTIPQSKKDILYTEAIRQKVIVQAFMQEYHKHITEEPYEYIRHSYDLSYIRIDALHGIAAFYEQINSQQEVIYKYITFQSIAKALETISWDAEIVFQKPVIQNNNLWLYEKKTIYPKMETCITGFEVFNYQGFLINAQEDLFGKSIPVGAQIFFINTINLTDCKQLPSHSGTPFSSTSPYLIHVYSEEGALVKKQLYNWNHLMEYYSPPITSLDYRINQNRNLMLYSPEHPSFFFLINEFGDLLQAPATYNEQYPSILNLPKHPELKPAHHVRFYHSYNPISQHYENELLPHQLHTHIADDHTIQPFFELGYNQHNQQIYLKTHYGIPGDKINIAKTTQFFYTSSNRTYKIIRSMQYYHSPHWLFTGIASHEYFAANGRLNLIEVYGIIGNLSEYTEYENQLLFTLMYNHGELTDIHHQVSPALSNWALLEIKQMYINRPEIRELRFQSNSL